MTVDAFNAKASELKNAFQQPLPQVNATIDSSGVLTVPHMGKAAIILVNTFGSVSSDEIVTVSPGPSDNFNLGDKIILMQAFQSRIFNVLSTGNVEPNGGNKWVSGQGQFIELTYNPDSPAGIWKETARFPATSTPIWKPGDFIVSGGVVNIDEDQRYLRVEGEYSGEVLATDIIPMPVISTAGNSLQCWVDDGNGPVMIGAYVSVGIPAFDSANWGFIINNDPNYGATWSATQITVSAPVGSGATPNGLWQMWVVETLSDGFGPTFAAGSTFSGGVDGTAQSDEIDTLNSGKDGQLVYLYNNMSSGKNLTTTSAGNFSSVFVIGSFMGVFLMFNGNTSKWDRVWGGQRSDVYTAIPTDYIDGVGTYNGVVVSVTSPGIVNDRLSVFYELQPSADHAFICRAKIPSNYIAQTDVTITVRYGGDGSGANNIYTHLGLLFVEAGTIVNTGESYANQTPAGPHAIPVPATADEMAEYSITYDGASIAATIEGGDDIFFVFLREGSNGSDSYIGTAQIYSIDFEFSVR
jgi:hypothetical protein